MAAKSSRGSASRVRSHSDRGCVTVGTAVHGAQNAGVDVSQSLRVAEKDEPPASEYLSLPMQHGDTMYAASHRCACSMA